MRLRPLVWPLGLLVCGLAACIDPAANGGAVSGTDGNFVAPATTQSGAGAGAGGPASPNNASAGNDNAGAAPAHSGNTVGPPPGAPPATANTPGHASSGNSTGSGGAKNPNAGSSANPNAGSASNANNPSKPGNGNGNATTGGTGAPASPNQVTSSPNQVSSSPNATPTPTPSKLSITAWPNVAFDDFVDATGVKAVALTFDDGPDGAFTGQDTTNALLDQLKALDLKATFFVCGNVWSTVNDNPGAQAVIRRILADGHEIGSHTYTHPHLDLVSTTALAAQFNDNQAMLAKATGSDASFTMIRAPFGFPFQTGNPNVGSVAPVAAPFGVHVGWGIDTDDWKCAQHNQGASCILDNLKSQLDDGHSGPILMHAVYPLTVSTLPDIVAMIRSYGLHIVMVEDMIQAKYGGKSADVMSAWRAAKYSNNAVAQDAVSSCNKNNVILVPY